MYAVLNEVDAFLFDAMTACIVFITIYFDLSLCGFRNIVVFSITFNGSVSFHIGRVLDLDDDCFLLRFAVLFLLFISFSISS